MDRSTYIRQNIENCHKNTAASRYQESGLTGEKAKLNHNGFNKLMAQRGISNEVRNDLRNSFSKGSEMQVRHAHAGEQFVTTHGIERSSGVFVSEQSLGITSSERIDRGALPHANSAEYETTVVLGKDQNLIYGEIAEQSKFSKMDPEQLPRNGGAIQIVTDGGYQSGAVINHDAKFPAVITDQDTLAVTQTNECRAENDLAMGGGETAVSNVDTDGIGNE